MNLQLSHLRLCAPYRFRVDISTQEQNRWTCGGHLPHIGVCRNSIPAAFAARSNNGANFILVVYQVLRLLSTRRLLAQLLCHPRLGGTLAYTGIHMAREHDIKHKINSPAQSYRFFS